MILFILIAVGIAIYTIYANGWLIDSIKSIEKNNKEIEENIKYGRTKWDSFSCRKYNKHDYDKYIKKYFILGFLKYYVQCYSKFFGSFIDIYNCC